MQNNATRGPIAVQLFFERSHRICKCIETLYWHSKSSKRWHMQTTSTAKRFNGSKSCSENFTCKRNNEKASFMGKSTTGLDNWAMAACAIFRRVPCRNCGGKLQFVRRRVGERYKAECVQRQQNRSVAHCNFWGFITHFDGGITHFENNMNKNVLQYVT